MPAFLTGTGNRIREILSMPAKKIEVVATVSPRSVGPASLFATDTPITCESCHLYRSKPEDVEAAKRALREAGFTVFDAASSDIVISIGGPAKLFAEFFGARLRKQKAKLMEDQEVEFLATGEEPEEALLAAPESLRPLIEGAVVARPPELFAASPLPPLPQPVPAAYRYLMLPDEVAVVLRAARVHRLGVTGRNVVVAMIDTGHYRHPWFTWHGYRVLPVLLGPGASDPSRDTNGHGTGESANVFATAPDVRLRPVKMAADTVGAINTALNSTPKPQVLTNSWGYNVDRGGASLPVWLRPLEATIANAVASGVVVCFSAGNGHYAFPASHPDVIAVGGVHVNWPDLELEASSYASSFDSSFYPGRHVPDVCGLTGKRVVIGGSGKAPSLMLPVQEGSALDGISPSTGADDDGWGLFSGTSAACPQVAGICALLLEKDSSLTPAKVKEKLMKAARDVKTGQSRMGDPAGPGPDAATGAGLADAKWSYLIAMGDVTAAFLAAPRDRQLEMISSGQMPEMPAEFIEDVIETLRSR